MNFSSVLPRLLWFVRRGLPLFIILVGAVGFGEALWLGQNVGSYAILNQMSAVLLWLPLTTLVVLWEWNKACAQLRMKVVLMLSLVASILTGFAILLDPVL